MKPSAPALALMSALLFGCSMAEPDGDGAPVVTFATNSTVPAAPTTDAPGDSSAATTTTLAPPTTDSVRFTVVASSLDQPLDVAWRGDDPTAFVVLHHGTIVPVRSGVVGQPVLDISERVSTGVEQGLLGLTFSADGSLAYTDHTDLDGDTVITEYRVASDGTFDVANARILLTISQPYDNHNGGNVVIGPDGMLYIGMGDGGSGGDPERRALDASSLLGKILRIDPTPTGDQPYSIPADNPYVDVQGARPEVWSVGLRNPWRFSFDPDTGDLWIGDVGQDLWEEVDVVGPSADHGAGYGVNFGWSALEGTHRFNEDQSTNGATSPVYEYAHSVEVGCSVTGGAVSRSAALPSLDGWYVFADFCSGGVFALRSGPGRHVDEAMVVQLGDLDGVSAIRAAPNGDLYVLDFVAGTLLVMQAA